MKHKARKVRNVHNYHLGFKEREYFTENLALLLRSGTPIIETLDSLRETASTSRMKKALTQMTGDVEAGYSLADALERSNAVSRQTLALVRLGESSGRLVGNLQLAALQEEKRHMFRSKIRSAMIYPAFVLSLTIVVGLGIAWFLLPSLANTFSQLHVKLPLISQIAIDFGLFLQAHGIIAVPAFLGGLFLIGYILFGAPVTKRLGRRMLLRLPGVGKLIRESEIAQFGYLLGTLLDAGLPVTRALQLLAEASPEPRYQKLYMSLAHSLDSGYSFKVSLRQFRHSQALIPAPVQQMIAAGERSGSLPNVLDTIGRTYEQKSDATASNLQAIIEPILLVIVWIGVMTVAVAVIVPVYSLIGGLD